MAYTYDRYDPYKTTDPVDPYANPYGPTSFGDDDPTSETPPTGGTVPQPPQSGGSVTNPLLSFGYTGPAQQSLIDVLYPGYKMQGGNLVWSGQGDPTYSAGAFGSSNSDTGYAVDRINKFANPLAGKDYQGFFKQLYGSNAATSANLTDAARRKILEAGGFHLSPANSLGYTTKVQAPDQNYYRVITGDPQAGGSWDWVKQGADEPPPPPTGEGDPSNFPAFEPPDFKAPEFHPPNRFTYPDFQDPTSTEAAAEPGYEFAEGRMRRAIQNSASAQGMGRAPETDLRLAQSVGDLASQNYANVRNRKLGTWQTNRGNQSDIYAQDWQKDITDYMLDYNSQADIYNRAAGTYQINAANRGSRQNFLLNLYQIATRGLPNYTPSAPPPNGFI